jgi:hypothetical protein
LWLLVNAVLACTLTRDSFEPDQYQTATRHKRLHRVLMRVTPQKDAIKTPTS